MPTPTLHPSTTSETADATFGVLLVAVDATAESDAGLRAANAIAQRTGARAIVLAVDPRVPIAAIEVQTAAAPAMNAAARVGLELQVRDQLERLGVGTDWPLRVVTGEPGASIAGIAEELGASLVVMGLGGHGWFDRLLGDETALRVLRLGRTPILAIAPDFQELPRRVLAAVDFSAASEHALKMAARIIAEDGELTIAHVAPAHTDPHRTVRNAAYQGSVARAIDRMVAQLELPAGATVRQVIRPGEAAHALLALVEEESPELIVTGSNRHNFLSRLRLGSVSSRLLRRSGRSILVAPPADAPGSTEQTPEERRRFAFHEWAERLDEFTRRNAGRVGTVEVIDPELGAQVEEIGMPFVGAAFDPRDARVQLMFGGERQGHLSRSIGDVRTIQILRDRDGRDRILRVAHGRGQTLLTLGR